MSVSTSAEPLFTDAGGYSIAYRRAGRGRPLVFLHGFVLDSRLWRRQLEDLSDEFTVVAWDAPGAGQSPDPPDTFSTADWARCLASFLDALDIDRAPIVGLSWGGILAQELYRLHPERVSALVLVDTYAGWRGSFPESICRQRLERCVGDSSLSMKELLSKWVPSEFFTEGAPADLIEEAVRAASHFQPHGFRLMARSSAETDTTEFLGRIEVPTLLVWGDADTRSPLSVAEQFRDAIPQAELVVIEGAGHVSNMEQPEVFNAHVRRFCLANPG